MKRSPRSRKRASERAKKDAEFRRFIMERDEGLCRVDGYGEHSRGPAHVSHFFTKGQHQWLRYDPDNACIMCLRHHLYWWHKEPIEADRWLKKYLGKAKYDALYKKAHTSPKLAKTRRMK